MEARVKIHQPDERRPGIVLRLGLLFFLLSFSLQAEPLHKKQSRFAHHSALLILHAIRTGHDVTYGEAWRSPEQAAFQTKINEEKGIGIAKSNHTARLAIDLNLFRNGKFLTTTDEYRSLGEWWENLCEECRWGGRFKKADANHFSFEHNGVQ